MTIWRPGLPVPAGSAVLSYATTVPVNETAGFWLSPVSAIEVSWRGVLVRFSAR